MPRKRWYEAVEEADDCQLRDVKMEIQGYDIDSEAVKAAMENAKRCGVEQQIHFQQRDVKDLSHRKKYGFLISNPPYASFVSGDWQGISELR